MRTRDGSAPPAAPETPPQPETHVSRAFAGLVEDAAGRSGVWLLDLGPAVGANVVFLSGLPAKLHIADLHQSLSPESGQPAHAGAFARSLRQDLPPADAGPMAGILAWDLLNYLQPEEIRALGAALAPFCAAGTLLFAQIWTTHELPRWPLVFEIEGADTLRHLPPAGALRPAPGYREPDLTRWLRRFRVETSYLLRNGLQEFLFTYDPAGSESAGG